MPVAVKRRLAQLGSIVDRWTLVGLATLSALSLALNVAQSALAERPPWALDVAEAAFISLGALATLSFGYASLLPEDDPNRRSFITTGAHFFRAVVFVTLAAAFEQFMRLYTQPPYSQRVVLYAVVLALLIVGSTYFFARALIPAWRGVTTILAAFERLEDQDD